MTLIVRAYRSGRACKTRIEHVISYVSKNARRDRIVIDPKTSSVYWQSDSLNLIFEKDLPGAYHWCWHVQAQYYLHVVLIDPNAKFIYCFDKSRFQGIYSLSRQTYLIMQFGKVMKTRAIFDDNALHFTYDWFLKQPFHLTCSAYPSAPSTICFLERKK